VLGYIPKAKKTFSSGVTNARCAIVSILTIFLLCVVVIIHGSAQSSQLDPSFGSGGKVTTDLFGGTDSVLALALQPDGKIVAAGVSFDPSVAASVIAMVRYNADGSIDSSFGNAGKVSTNFFGQRLRSSLAAITLQPDSKIVAVGFAEALTADLKRVGHAVAARYSPAGSLDTSFGDGGKLIIDFPVAIFSPNAVGIQQDGKILIAGQANPDPAAPGNTVGALERLNSDGSLDASFGSGGMVMTAFPNGPSSFSKFTIQQDGLIIAAGAPQDTRTGASSFALARYKADGNLDPSFGSGGLVTTALAGFGELKAVAVVENKIVVAGFVITGTDPRSISFAAARYNGDGSVDPGFGPGGIATADFFEGAGHLTSGAIRSDGKFIMGGFVGAPKSQAKGGTSLDFALQRYNADGSVDTSFGSAGKVITEFSDDENDEMFTLAIQPDRKIIAAGATSGGDDFALARYQTDPDFDLSFAQSTVNVDRGTVARTSLQLGRFGGFAGNITVSHSDTSGFNVRVKPDSVVTADPSVIVKFKVKPNAPTGPHQIVFTGQDDSGQKHSAAITIVVR